MKHFISMTSVLYLTLASASSVMAVENAAAAPKTDGAGKADIIVVGGKIFTSDPLQPYVEAFAVKDGKFSYVGDFIGAIDQIGESTVFIADPDSFVCPGFVDNHNHFLWIGALTSMMPWNLFNCQSVDDVKKVVMQMAKNNPTLPFVGGIGWKMEYIPGRHPTSSMIDDAVPDRPVLLMSDGGQSGWLNSNAVSLLSSRNPDAFEEMGPVRDGSGNPTGEFARFHCFDPFEFFTADEMAKAERHMISAMWRVQREALSFGITSFHDVQLYKGFYPYLLKFKEQGGFDRMRATSAFYIGPGMYKNIEKLTEDLEWWTSLADAEHSDEHLMLGKSVKFYIDGVSSNNTSFLFEPFTNDPTTTGVPDWTQEDFDKVVSLVDSMKIQACTHSCGDAGANRVINSYEASIKANPAWDRRHRLDHCELPIAADQARMAALGLIAAMHPTHFFGSPHDFYIGDRVNRLMPWQSMLDAGVEVCFGSDWCAGPANPLYGILVASTRLNHKFETSWGTENAVSLEEAIVLYTAKSAFAIKMDGWTGVIKEGKNADFAVFSRDLTDITSYLDILKQKNEMGTGLDDLVLATFTDGRLAYCKSGWTSLDVSKADITFNFSKQKSDSLLIKGCFEWPVGLDAEGSELKIEFGDLNMNFILDKKGKGKTGGNTSISVKIDKYGFANFAVKASKSNLFDTLKKDGFVSDAKIKNEIFSLPLVISLAGDMHSVMVELKYSAKKGKSGKASGKAIPFDLPSFLADFWWEDPI